MSMVGIVAALAVTGGVIWMILKKFQPQIVLFTAGIVLLIVAAFMGVGPEQILPKKVATTGFIGFDIFKFIERTLSSRVAGLGLMIMSAGGFAKYMDHIGASRTMVFTVIKPLQRLRAPYVMLSLTYIVGASLKIFIGSAAGLGMLLMVTMYPIVVALGASRAAAAAMVVTCGCFDLGPGSGNSNLAAQTAGVDVAEYFVTYQIPTAIFVGYTTIAVMHYFVQRYFDRKDKVGIAGGVMPEEVNVDSSVAGIDEKTEKLPVLYALLPTVPLVLLLTFSLGVEGYKLDVVTVMIMSFAFAILCEVIRTRQVKKVMKDCMLFFQTMGTMFATVISLIVAGETFARGLTATGAVDSFIAAAQSLGFGATGMTIIMTAFIVVAAIVMGSGNAPFFAFASLVPKIASDMGVHAVVLILPMQLCVGAARALSPIVAIVVAVAGIANVSPFELVRRTAIPVGTALVTTTAASLLLFQ